MTATQRRSMRGAEDPTDEEAAAAAKRSEAEAEDEDAGYVTVEYVGEPPYYTEFLTSHTIYKSPATGKGSDRSFAGQDIDVPQDLVWHRDTGWTLKVDASLTELLDGLRAQPFLKVRD